jgi:transcriptional regulator with XRE-family HTH domain
MQSTPPKTQCQCKNAIFQIKLHFCIVEFIYMQMPTLDDVATLNEIGGALETARKLGGFSDKDLAAAANVALSTLSRWKSGEVEPGAQSLARAAVFVGTTPDELLLRESVDRTGFQDEEFSHLDRAVKALRRLQVHGPAVQMYADALESIERTLIENGRIPRLTQIEVDGNTTKFEPPPKSERYRSGDTPTDKFKAGEDAGEYQKPKGKKKPT